MFSFRWMWAVGSASALTALSCTVVQTSGTASGAGGSGSGGSGAGASGAGGSGATASGTGGSTGAGGAAACMPGGSSTLPSVSIEFPGQNCTFTLAQAAAGITIDYQVVVTQDTPGIIADPQDAGACGLPGSSGLIVFEDLSGNGQHYCLCDTGLCPGPSGMPVTLPAGTYAAAFSWAGKNWGGPSDTGQPMGPPFPVGDYTLKVSAIGNVMDSNGSMPFSVTGTFPIRLIP